MIIDWNTDSSVVSKIKCLQRKLIVCWTTVLHIFILFRLRQVTNVLFFVFRCWLRLNDVWCLAVQMRFCIKTLEMSWTGWLCLNGSRDIFNIINSHCFQSVRYVFQRIAILKLTCTVHFYCIVYLCKHCYIQTCIRVGFKSIDFYIRLMCSVSWELVWHF